MCTKQKRGLAWTQFLLFMFATVFLSFGLCQNAEPKRSFEFEKSKSRETEQREESYDFTTLDQRLDPSRWEGSQGISRSLEEGVKDVISSLADIGSSQTKAETLAIRSSPNDKRNMETSELKNPDYASNDETMRKSSLATVSTRCNNGRGSKRRLCANELRLNKKRRRYSSLRRDPIVDGETDYSPRNRIHGSSGRSRRIQEKGQTRSKYRGRKRNGKRTRKQGNNGEPRMRKNNKFVVGTSAEAPSALHNDDSEKIRNSDAKNKIRKGFGTEETNETFVGIGESRESPTGIKIINDKDSAIIKNIDAGNTIRPIPITMKPEETKQPYETRSDNALSKNLGRPEVTRKRHEENVEHEFSRNLEQEILWSRTELPDGFLENPVTPRNKINSTYSWTQIEKAKSDEPLQTGKNDRFDAAKMLGYSRSAEDIPIMDLENEVLARTLKDYNAYLKNGLNTPKLLDHSDERDRNSQDHRKDETSQIPRRPAYKHVFVEEKKNDRKLHPQQQTDQTQPEVLEAVNSETSAPLRGDLSCINGTFMPAPLAHHALIKYVKSSMPGHEYLEADYECSPGFYMASSNRRLLCKNRRWIGELPSCKIRRGQPGPCAESSCDQVCNEVGGQAKCACYKGFRLDDHKCMDINECEINNGRCEHKCVNTPGSCRCECPQGMKRGEDEFTCIDVNECLLNNGHGACQDTCRNHEGGYVCSCEGLPGTVLSSDNHTCKDSGPCAINNAGCSHTCLSTMGRVFCLCPDGFMLADDWKTCQDVDECYVPDLQTEICHYGCINTPGSYRCVDPAQLSDEPIRDSLSITCFPGYELTVGSNCVDINECATNNGGCTEVCENTDGSFFCACDGDEKALSADGKSCTDINDLSCPPLDPARRGYLMCSRETTPRMWRDGGKAANRPGTKCYLKCPSGYQLHGEYELTCQGDGTWDGPKHGECVKYSKPRLECPKDVVAEVPPDRDEAFVTFDQPSTDLDWFRYVRSKPSWGTRLEASLKPGTHLVTFYARHPVSKKQASCIIRIVIKEGEAPKVNNCPSDIAGKNGTSFTWTEPTFTDNIKVTHTSKNESPGKSFGIGEWKVVYEASDEAGWTTRCVFSVVVHQD